MNKEKYGWKERKAQNSLWVCCEWIFHYFISFRFIAVFFRRIFCLNLNIQFGSKWKCIFSSWDTSKSNKQNTTKWNEWKIWWWNNVEIVYLEVNKITCVFVCQPESKLNSWLAISISWSSDCLSPFFFVPFAFDFWEIRMTFFIKDLYLLIKQTTTNQWYIWWAFEMLKHLDNVWQPAFGHSKQKERIFCVFLLYFFLPKILGIFKYIRCDRFQDLRKAVRSDRVQTLSFLLKGK